CGEAAEVLCSLHRPGSDTPARASHRTFPGGNREDSMIIDAGSSFSRGLISSYRIDRLIGRGATSRVYLATHIFLRRPTAIKVLTCDFASWPDFDLELFERTAVAAARLHHPNVVTLYDIDEVRARPYILMEYVDGWSLQDLLRRRGPISPARALRI